MRIMVLFGTRPEIIRLSQVITRLDAVCEQTLVYTGQNFDPGLSRVFFEELGVRRPDIHLGIEHAGFAEQVGQILARTAQTLTETRPDRLLVLGDTNSGLGALAAARMGVPVYHMEAGNRCCDRRVPEEINRRVIDHVSDVLMPYTHRSKENLLREGIARERIFVIGNPIREVLDTYAPQVERSEVLGRLGLAERGFFLATLHRAESVDYRTRLEALLSGLSLAADTYQEPVIVSVHPHTADRLREWGLKADSQRVRLLEPLGFFDFVKLERNAHCVLTDSGTVQEECCILKVPSVTVRDVTERAETVECGSGILAGTAPESILGAVDIALTSVTDWTPPCEYLERHVSETVAKVVLGFGCCGG